MKKLIILFFILSCNLKIEAQASFDTKIAFILYDEKNQIINFEQLKIDYQFVDVFGRIIPSKNLKKHLDYDEKTNYFILNIETIGPRFSFAIYHENKRMIVYLPFNNKDIYYALNFKFREGRYLFDFNTKNKKKIHFKSNSSTFFLIKRIHWKKQHSKLMKNKYYAIDETYTKIKNK